MFRFQCRPAQEAFTGVIKAIAQFEPVTVCCNPAQLANAQLFLKNTPNVEIIELPHDDAWFRDTGPTVSYTITLPAIFLSFITSLFKIKTNESYISKTTFLFLNSSTGHYNKHIIPKPILLFLICSLSSEI